MTSQEYSEMVETERLWEKMVSKLCVRFPKHMARADDWAARAIVHGLRKCEEFKDLIGARSYVFDLGTFDIPNKDLKREKIRRDSLEGVRRVTVKRYDPTRRIDYKVDLEKAIKLTTGHRIIQQALWHIHFEEFTWNEVIELMPKDIPQGTWNSRIARANADLQRRLRAYGYRG